METWIFRTLVVAFPENYMSKMQANNSDSWKMWCCDRQMLRSYDLLDNSESGCVGLTVCVSVVWYGGEYVCSECSVRRVCGVCTCVSPGHEEMSHVDHKVNEFIHDTHFQENTDIFNRRHEIHNFPRIFARFLSFTPRKKCPQTCSC